MKATDIVKSVMKVRNINQGEITRMMGMQSQSAVSQALNRDLKISTLLRFLNTLDCEIIIRDKNTGQEYSVDD